MKNYLLFIAIFTLIQQAALCQMNLDSLKNELEGSFVEEMGSNDWNAYVIRYLDKDSLVKYVIPFDKDGAIEEDVWGIALTEYKYDDKNREVQRRYFNREGALHFSDWPPVIRIYYDDKDRVTKEEYLGINEEPVISFSKIEFKYNFKGELLEERMYGETFDRIGEKAITRFAYEDSSRVVIASEYTHSGELVVSENVAYRSDEYLTSERKKLIETRFLDKNMELTGIVDIFSEDKYAIARYSYPPGENRMKLEKFDSKMVLISESWQYLPPSNK